MKKRSAFPGLSLVLLAAYIAGPAYLFPASVALAQSTSVRTPVNVTGVSAGIVCDQANGWAMSTNAVGQIGCTQSVTNATNATNAQNAVNATTAVTATSATTAGTAQTLDPSAHVAAGQITGVIAASNLPAGSGSGGVGCIGTTSPNFSRPGSFVIYVNGANVWSTGVTGNIHGTYPSLGSGQSTTFPVSGSAYEPTTGYSVPLNGSAKATCNADATVSFSNWSWSGNIHQDLGDGGIDNSASGS